MIAEVGYAKASIRRIAERVGVAMSVVLYHFSNKDDLIAAVVAESYRSAFDLMVPAVTAATTARGKLRAGSPADRRRERPRVPATGE